MSGIEVGFLVDDLMDQMRGAADDSITTILGLVDTKFYEMITGRTPRDDVTRKGKAKSTEEHIQASWQHEIDAGSRSVMFGTDFVYAPVLDLGGYPGIGPRTTGGAGGIYSRQAPRGIVQDLMKDSATIDDALEMIMQKLPERLQGLQVAMGK